MTLLSISEHLVQPKRSQAFGINEPEISLDISLNRSWYFQLLFRFFLFDPFCIVLYQLPRSRMDFLENKEKQSQIEIASHIGRLLREAFGKGPQSIFVNIRRPFIVIYLRNFLSPTEKILLEQDQVFAIQHTRDLVMKSLVPEIKAYLLLLAGMNIQEFYYDWGLHNQSGIVVGIENDDSLLAAKSEEDYTGKEELHREIEQLSHQIQKKPNEIYSFKINERTLLVIRKGFLISIGKELIRLGFEENWKLAERNLTRRYLQNNNRFPKILNADKIDAFTDWNFYLDKSVIVFILTPISSKDVYLSRD